MFLALLAALLQRLRRSRRAKRFCLPALVVLVLCLTAGSAWQRLVIRQDARDGKLQQYELLGRGIENGILDGVADADTLICDYNVWGYDTGAECAFIRRYNEREMNACQTHTWKLGWGTGTSLRQGTLWRMGTCSGYSSCGGVWLSRLHGSGTYIGDDLLLYVDFDIIPADAELHYTVQQGHTVQTLSVRLQDLPCTERNADHECFVTLESENIRLDEIELTAASG